MRRELVRGGRSPVHQVGQAAAEREEAAVFRWMEETGGEARRVQRRPEPITGTGEVEARGGRVEAGVDAAEENPESRGEDVAQALAVRGGEGGLARTA
jgi:hypothetical protein